MQVRAVVGSLTAGEIACKAMSTTCKDPERRLADPVLDERDEHARRERRRGESQHDEQDRVNDRDDRDHRAGDRPEYDMSRLRLRRENPVEQVIPRRDRRDPPFEVRQADGQGGHRERDSTRPKHDPSAQPADDMPQTDPDRFSHRVLLTFLESRSTGAITHPEVVLTGRRDARPERSTMLAGRPAETQSGCGVIHPTPQRPATTRSLVRSSSTLIPVYAPTYWKIGGRYSSSKAGFHRAISLVNCKFGRAFRTAFRSTAAIPQEQSIQHKVFLHEHIRHSPSSWHGGCISTRPCPRWTTPT